MKKLIIILIVIAALGGIGFYVWENINIGFNKQDLLLSRFNQFSSTISVNLCQQAYDEFITSHSKQVKGDNFFAHCKYRNKNWSNLHITGIVFSNNNRADIKYTYDLANPDLDSKYYQDCIRFTSAFSCADSAPTKIVKENNTETWLYQNGKWMRDY